jgi:hypothetical protein
LIEYEKSFAVCRFGFTILKRFMPEDKLADVKGATLTVDGTGVVFDVPAADAVDYIQGILCFHFYDKKKTGVKMKMCCLFVFVGQLHHSELMFLQVRRLTLW